MRSLVAVLLLASPICAADPAAVPMFNGKDLAGWRNVNTAPGTFFVKGNEVVTTGRPTGFLATEKQYENFEMEVEWMHVEKKNMANSGIFIWGDPLPAVGQPYTRGIEVQVLLNYKPADGWATSDGDIFSIHGATCKPDRPHPKGLERCLPSENRTKPAGEWNHYKIVANDGTIKLHVNGKEVSGVSQCSPRKGYLALESEGVECHFRNLKIKELPSTNPTAEQTCPVYAGHKSLFDGLTLTGWTGDGWKAGGVLRSPATGDLTADAKLTAGELIFDWKLPAKAAKQECTIDLGGKPTTLTATKPGQWTRATLAIAGGPLTIKAAEGLEVMNVFFAAKK